VTSRSAKKFPPGTFIPTPQRFMAIGQLCLAFSLLLWYMTQPFMGEYFTLRSRMLLYEYVMGTSDILKNRVDQEAKSKRQLQRFKGLPEEEKQLLKGDYQNLQEYAKRPALKKIADGIHVLTRDIPPFEQAWIVFSITIAILILLKKDGANLAAWIIPLIVMAYIVDNQLNGKTIESPLDYSLFPTEQLLLQNYLAEPLAKTTFEQKQQLEEGWQRYLIKNWSSVGKNKYNDPVEEGEFNFTLARLKLLRTQPLSSWLHSFNEKLGFFSMFFYLLWNGLFGWIIGRPKLEKFAFIKLH
jgi:hypothetical protein